MKCSRNYLKFKFIKLIASRRYNDLASTFSSTIGISKGCLWNKSNKPPGTQVILYWMVFTSCKESGNLLELWQWLCVTCYHCWSTFTAGLCGRIDHIDVHSPINCFYSTFTIFLQYLYSVFTVFLQYLSQYIYSAFAVYLQYLLQYLYSIYRVFLQWL